MKEVVQNLGINATGMRASGYPNEDTRLPTLTSVL
jgi:hypothetical protein